jgi:hypothetical protein
MGNGEGYLRVEKVRVVGWVVAVDRWGFGLDGVETLDEFHQRRQLTLQQIENVQVIVHRGGLARIIRLLDGWPEWNLFETPPHNQRLLLYTTSNNKRKKEKEKEKWRVFDVRNKKDIPLS